jgi:hypothetical protein
MLHPIAFSERLGGSQSLGEAGETVVGERLKWRGVRDELVGLRSYAWVLVQASQADGH